MENNQNDVLTIDLMQIWKAVWHRMWLIVLVAIVGASLTLSYAVFFVQPQYESSVMLYVNNKSDGSGTPNFNISSSDITASQNLVKMYREILMNRDTLQAVINEADLTYTHAGLKKMITAEAANQTQIMRVTVTADDPDEAAKIANCIAEVLPVRVSKIIEGATMVVVESAVANPNKVSPSITKYTVIGGLIGALLIGVIVVLRAILDDTIQDEEYLLQTYDYPILAKVPDLVSGRSKGYGYYYREKAEKADEKEGR